MLKCLSIVSAMYRNESDLRNVSLRAISLHSVVIWQYTNSKYDSNTKKFSANNISTVKALIATSPN